MTNTRPVVKLAASRKSGMADRLTAAIAAAVVKCERCKRPACVVDDPTGVTVLCLDCVRASVDVLFAPPRRRGAEREDDPWSDAARPSTTPPF